MTLARAVFMRQYIKDGQEFCNYESGTQIREIYNFFINPLIRFGLAQKV